MDELIRIDQQLLLALNGSDNLFWDHVMCIVTKTTTWIPLALALCYVMVKNANVRKGVLFVLCVAVLTIVMYIYLNYSKQGYEISVVGESVATARYVGIKVGWTIMRTLILSGAICGLTGYLLVAGTEHTLTTSLAGGQGFTAVMVAWLAKFNPLGMVLSSLLLIFLARGAGEISTIFGLNQSFGDILTGIILFFIIGSEFFINYKVNFRKKEKKAA